MTVYWTTTPSPLGDLLLTADDNGLTAVSFVPHAPVEGEQDGDHPVLDTATNQLAEYFSRDRKSFELPLAPRGSEFRQRVWAALRDIPYGSTTSYGALAGQLGLSGHGARAVGLANGSNPLAIVVPCHRVVGSTGALTGYAGGLDRKRQLLALEGAALF